MAVTGRSIGRRSGGDAMGWITKRRVQATAGVAVVVALVAAWLVYQASRVNDPEDAACPDPETTLGSSRIAADHRELDVEFRCEGAVLAGTAYLPLTKGPHPAVVWVHGAGEAPRLTWGGDLLPGLIEAGVVVLSYDKRGVGESEGECCPGDTGHFNLLIADAEGAVAVLRGLPDVDAKRVGLVGASQAGWIAPRAAVDSGAAFVALAAAPTIAERTTNLYERLAAGEEGDLSRDEIADRLREEGSKGYNPRQDLAAMTMPGLWEFGSADDHTPTEESVEVLEQLNSEGHDFTIVTFTGAGHGLLDNPPAAAEAPTTLIDWVTDHAG
jgi:alpha-beta hydrolase superfamily lysophospholipase